ncbi:MAG TPA: glycosyltransferase family 4 protein [Gaiellaceae bacterium]|nr:glycosyltransferase family 4 protein [Gaiellaceae bacterium]
MRLVFVTQQIDPGHPALAATVPMVRALAAQVDEVVVLADRALPEVLPANCRVRSFGAAARAGRGLKFESALALELAHRPRPAAVVAHMCPIYAVLAAPLARPVGTKVLLWFTHWRASRTLRLAERVSNAVLSVDRRTFPLPSAKVRGIGHGIDLSEFPCSDAEPAHSDLRLLALGRYSTAKGLEVVLRGLRLAVDGGLDARLELYGPALSPAEREHRAQLERLVGELELERRVRLGHAVLRSEVPALLGRADVLVNNMRAGATDKVVYEACASCTPAVASNPAFDTLLPDELRFDRDDPRTLADRLLALGASPPEARRRLGRDLRERVAAGHSVESWAAAVVEAAT